MGHQFHDEECEMFDPEFLNTSQEPAKTSKSRQAGPQSERPVQIYRDDDDSLRVVPLKLNKVKEIEVGGKEEVQVHNAHASPFPKNHPNPSPTDLPARNKHNDVPPQLLNADQLAQIISTETMADVIIDDTKACALLDSEATADLMTLTYAEVRNFDIRLMME